MTVQDLIKKLQQFDPSSIVLIPGTGMQEGGWMDAVTVETVRLVRGTQLHYMPIEDGEPDFDPKEVEPIPVCIRG